jgi:hypothetical protein
MKRGEARMMRTAHPIQQPRVGEHKRQSRCTICRCASRSHSPSLDCERLTPECFPAFAGIFADVLPQGVNTVGALVIAFSLVFLISSASSQSTRPQQGQQQLQNQRWGSGPVSCHSPSHCKEGRGANAFLFLQAERLHTAETLPQNVHPRLIILHRIPVMTPC